LLCRYWFLTVRRGTEDAKSGHVNCALLRLVMKKVLLPFLLGIAFTLACLFTPAPTHNHVTIDRPVTIQQRAEHRLAIKDAGLCTATAVGPHAILTAVHCNDKDLTEVEMDLSMRKYHILSKTLDGRDHVIYIVDGPEFHDIITLHPGDAPAQLFEHTYIYGCGGGVYPPEYKEGFKSLVVKDVSEIDKADGLNYYTIPVIPGDSGAAVYGSDGRVIAVVTYQFNRPIDNNWDNDSKSNTLQLSASFDIDFTEAQLAAIAVGLGDTTLVEKAAPPKKAARSIFDLF
jgi:hypothetical protein